MFGNLRSTPEAYGWRLWHRIECPVLHVAAAEAEGIKARILWRWPVQSHHGLV